MARLDFKSDYICTYKNVLNKQQCQHLIDKFEDSPTQQTKTIVDNHMSFTEINISMHNDWKEYTGIIFPKLRQVIDKYTKENTHAHKKDTRFVLFKHIFSIDIFGKGKLLRSTVLVYIKGAGLIKRFGAYSSLFATNNDGEVAYYKQNKP